MAYQVPDKIVKMMTYQPIEGEYPIRLDANESYNDFSSEIPLDFFKQIRLNRYPDPYCSELCRLYGEMYGVSPEHLTAGNGSDELISLIVGSLLEKGDALVTIEPDFSMYRFYADVFELKACPIRKNAELAIDVDAVITAARESGARALIFSNPCNPTSLVLSRQEVLRLLDELECLVVVDEAYMDFSVDHSVMKLVDRYDNLIVLKTFSKALGMAAIRLGFAVAGSLLTRALRTAKSPYNVNSVTQQLGCLLLQTPALIYENISLILGQRYRLAKELQVLAEKNPQIKTIYPSNTNFVFIQLDGAPELFEALREQGIIVRLMGREHLRITAGSVQENDAFLRAFKSLLKSA